MKEKTKNGNGELKAALDDHLEAVNGLVGSYRTDVRELRDIVHNVDERLDEWESRAEKSGLDTVDRDGRPKTRTSGRRTSP